MNPTRMSPRRTTLLAAALSVLAAAGPHAAAETWTFRNGSTTEGDFVRVSKTHLFVRRGGQVTSIPLASLSQASMDLAKAASQGMLRDFVTIHAGRHELGLHQKKQLSETERQIPFLREDMPFRYAVITRPFEIKATEVTCAEWRNVREAGASRGYKDLAEGRSGSKEGNPEETHPVTEVSWWDAVKWCNLLSEAEGRKPCYHSKPGFTGESVLRSGSTGDVHVDWEANGYRLPTEAEWEAAWATRGSARGHEEPDGWHQDNSEGNTHPVRSRASATDKTLHDMLGNVAEWCWDWHGPVTVTGSDKDPRGPATGTRRIFRGGSWADHRWCCHGSYRGDFSPAIPRSPFVGFRPVRLSSAPARRR